MRLIKRRHGNERAGQLFVLAAAGLLAAMSARAAQNLLVNPGFEQDPSKQAVPTGWTYYAPPTTTAHDYWIVDTNSVGCGHLPPNSGAQYWKQWGALYAPAPTNNVAGIYQVFSSAPGSIYQAGGWLMTSGCDQLGQDCYTWVQVEFLNSSTNLVGLYKSSPFSATAGVGVWLQYAVTNACDLTQPVSTGDPYFTTYAITGSVNQLVAPAGTASVRFRYCYLQAGTEGGSAFLDDAALTQISGPIPPVISDLFPQNMIFVNPTSAVSFTVTSPSGFTINNSSIHMALNGTDVSGSLAISGTPSSKNVAYSGLQSNTTYALSITVTDSANFTVSANTTFQTMWVGVPPPTYLWEAEDWDFTNGMYIDFPDLCNASGDPNCYFGKVGTLGVDENSLSGASGSYRPGDFMGQAAAGDSLRPDLYTASRLDYCINPFIQNEWVNYTRDWPNSTNWVIARLATDINLSGFLTLSLVNPDSTTTALGTFTITGGKGWTTFENVYLKDSNGNNALVTLNGKQTLRLTSGGNLLPNFLMLVPAQLDLPLVSQMYPTGTHPFEPTNALSFTASTFGTSFPANGIRVNLDGIDVSTNLVITGSGATNHVVYPGLLSNAVHVAVITLTNLLGHGIVVTNQFDTFSEANYMVEAEDFDYEGGQYITNWFPDAYADGAGPYPALTNVDYQHTTLSGEVFRYRSVGIPQDVLGPFDYLRMEFANSGSVDYVLVFFAGGDWANYTRDYPPGKYYAYIRTSGDGPFSMYLDQVVSGAGTTSQVTKRLGHFGGVGQNYTTYAWVPLTDDGLTAPAVVSLNGTTTLRLTTAGNCNPNFFMLVPTSGIRLSLSAVAGHTVLSFPTQAGVNYSVFYRTNLNSGNWTLLTTFVGNGSVKSVSDPTTGSSRFYKVTAP